MSGNSSPRDTGTRAKPRGRTAAWIGVTLVVLLVGSGAAALAIRQHSRTSFVESQVPGVCDLVTRVAASANSPSPFGTITSCQVVGDDVHLFGDVDADIYLLTETDAGALGLRIEYTGPVPGRQYRAVAFEATADQLSLSASDDARLRHDVDARGGVSTQSWPIHYGDG